MNCVKKTTGDESFVGGDHSAVVEPIPRGQS